MEVQRGILDFAQLYLERIGKEHMIQGADAYAPIALVLNNMSWLKDVIDNDKFTMNLGVKGMILQNVIYPDEVCGVDTMFFRTDGVIELQKKRICLQPGNLLKTNTYMNILDRGYWEKYTIAKHFYIDFRAGGNFIFRIKHMSGTQRSKIIFEQKYENLENEIFHIQIPYLYKDGLIFWEIEAVSETIFYEAAYSVQEPNEIKDVRLAINICTFHRNEQLNRNLKKFSESYFFRNEMPMYGKLRIYVIDNGMDFESSYASEWIQIFREDNSGGGTGGFTRGLQEIETAREIFQNTHTVFMDDDVEFQMESFYRLYVFLSLIKDKYKNTPVAGRMFRLDNRSIQYTAVERWNHGDIIHVSGNSDMSLEQGVIEEKDIIGDYGGWWFCVYPSEITSKNRPFPFFIHCDDVEYGLRQGEKTIILRGVQVWHETYEYRINPTITYYDIRNSLVVNAVYEQSLDKDMLIRQWKDRLDAFHNAGDETSEFLCTLAMWDFCIGKIFLKQKGKLSDFSLHMSKRSKFVKFIFPFFHRITEKMISVNYHRILKFYRQKIKEEVWQFK